MQTEVYKHLPVRFDMTGQIVSRPISLTNESISHGLACRLYNYALNALDSAGFKETVKDWLPSVYTLDGDDSPSDRAYCVRWTNNKDGYIEVIGILTRKGWPSLDHGLSIGR